MSIDRLLHVMALATGRRVWRVPVPYRLARHELEHVRWLRRLLRVSPQALDYFVHPTIRHGQCLEGPRPGTGGRAALQRLRRSPRGVHEGTPGDWVRRLVVREERVSFSRCPRRRAPRRARRQRRPICRWTCDSAGPLFGRRADRREPVRLLDDRRPLIVGLLVARQPFVDADDETGERTEPGEVLVAEHQLQPFPALSDGAVGSLIRRAIRVEQRLVKVQQPVTKRLELHRCERRHLRILPHARNLKSQST